MAVRSLFCPKCGTRVEVDDNREYFFCNKCGRRNIVPRVNKPASPEIKREKRVETIPNLCTRCNGTLKLSADNESAVCEYCGAIYNNKTIYVSRDETEIHRAEYEAQKRKIELEAEERKRKLEIEAEEKRRQEERELEEKQAKRRRVLNEVLGWIFGVIFYGLFVYWAINHHYGRTSVFLILLVVFTISICLFVFLSVNKKNESTDNNQNADEIITDNGDNNISIGNNGCVNMGNTNKNINYSNVKTSSNIAKGVATGAAIGAGLTAAGLAIKGIRKIFK